MSSAAKDEDSVFLEHVLDKLYDFGSAPTKKKKKNKRRRCDEEEEEEEASSDVCRKEDGLKDRRGREEEEEVEEEQQVEEELEEEVEVVTFQDPRKKLRVKQTAASSDEAAVTVETQNDRLEEINLEKARLEVHRFGITGYRKEQQRVFEQDRAVMLGARPPKKSYVNYKLLQQQVKDRKQRAREEVQPELKKKKKKKKSSQQDNRKRASPGSGAAPTGQVGRFKDGMLLLSSKEIQKIKGRRAAR